MIHGWTNEALLDEVVAAPRASRVTMPESRLIVRPGRLWQIVTPTFRQGGMNEVAQFVLEAADAEEAIDAAIAEYARHDVRFRWPVFPGSRPDDLPARLARRGLVREETRGMVFATDGLDASADAEVTVEHVDASNLHLFTDVMAQGWEMDAEPLRPVHEAFLNQPGGGHRLLVARWRGEPAATAGHVLLERSVYLLGGVVLPAFRRRGLYRALVAARLREARERGIELAVVQAREMTSAPLLARMGFATICRYPTFLGG